MSTNLTDPRTPDDPEAEFLAELDAAVSGYPVRDGSDLLATAIRVRHLAASDPRTQLDSARQQEIWDRIIASQRTTLTTHKSTGRAAQKHHVRQRSARPFSRYHAWRPGGWIGTAVAICLLAMLALPLARALGTNDRFNAPVQLPAQTRNATLGSGDDMTIAPTSTPNVIAPTRATAPEEGLLAPPSTVIATAPSGYDLATRLEGVDPRQTVQDIEQSAFQYDLRGTLQDTFIAAPYTSGAPLPHDAVSHIAISHPDDKPIASFLVFYDHISAADWMKQIGNTPGLMTQEISIGSYPGYVVYNNDRVTTVVQIANVLVMGYAWTSSDDWMSSELDLQQFKWQSMQLAVGAIAYLDRVTQNYPSPPAP